VSDNLEQSTIDSAMKYREKPKPIPLKDEGRVSTLDAIAMDLMAKPISLMKGDRISTIDALELSFDDDPIISKFALQRETSREKAISDMKRGLAKPRPVTLNDRLTTTDFLELVNAPIGED